MHIEQAYTVPRFALAPFLYKKLSNIMQQRPDKQQTTIGLQFLIFRAWHIEIHAMFLSGIWIMMKAGPLHLSFGKKRKDIC